MRGIAVQAAIIGIVVLLLLLATAHWWAPQLARVLRQLGHNLSVAGDALFRFARRLIGQGQTRPQAPKDRRTD